MKKILTAVMALFITTSLVQAQDQSKTTEKAPASQSSSQSVTQSSSQSSSQSPNKSSTQSAATKCDVKNCYTMKTGKVVCIKDGKEVAMNEDVKLANGSIVHVDGSMETKDGRKIVLKEGECVDMNGTMGRMQKPRTVSSSDKVAEPVKAAPAQAEPAK